MRKEYGKALRSLFAAQMKLKAPQYAETKPQSAYFSPGDRAFCCALSDSLYCWIELHPNPKDYDNFTVTIGWSTLGRYPELNLVPCLERPSKTRSEYRQQEYLTRLPFLWTDNDEWWWIKDYRNYDSVTDMLNDQQPISSSDAQKAVSPIVEDAVNKIVQIGIPYLSAFGTFIARSEPD